MGKTIQTIATIVRDVMEHKQNAVKNKKKRKAATITGSTCARETGSAGPTLVVAPSSAMLQWADEIRRSTAPGTLNVLVYYNNSKGQITREDIYAADVVLTTFPVLEMVYRKVCDQHKVSCQYCSRKLLPRSLVWHNKYFCGPDASRTLKQSKQEQSKRKEATLKAMKTLKIGDDII